MHAIRPATSLPVALASLFSIASLAGLALSGCKSRQYNEADSRGLSDEGESADSDKTIRRDETPENKVPDCAAHGVTLVPSVAYATPQGAAETWTASNALISTYQQANGMFPQINFGIRIYMMDHLLRDPFLNFESMYRVELTAPQWRRIAKVMTSLHKAHGVKWSSASFTVPDTRPVPDTRVQGLIRGAIQGALSYAHGSLVRYAVASDAQAGATGLGQSSFLSTAFEEAFHAPSNGAIDQRKRCVLTRVVGLMREAFATPEVRAVNETWKGKITSGEAFNRKQFYETEIRARLKPVFESKIATPDEKEAFAVVWENLTY